MHFTRATRFVVLAVLLLAYCTVTALFGFTGWKLLDTGFVLLLLASVFVANCIRDNRPYFALFGLTCCWGFAIHQFARIHSTIGLIDGTTETHDYWTALYFSVMTWTTVGYGDVQPTTADRIFAASEALLGLVFMGLYVAVAIRAIEQLAVDRTRR